MTPHPSPEDRRQPGGAARTRALLGAICFTSGALTLVIEVAGNRLLAPLFGNSLSTWTALIGVILVAISAGDFLGGVLVDRAPRLPPLGYLLLAAAGWTFLVPVIHARLLAATAPAWSIDGPVVASLALFAIPACLLAAAGPFVIRLLSRTGDDHAIGLSAGVVGMLTTLGSFSSTFLTGFYLIPTFGVRAIFLMAGTVAAVLGAAVLAWSRAERRPAAGVALAAVGLLGALNVLGMPPRPAHVIHERQTFYHDLRVEESTTEHGERIRSLRLDTTLEGGQYVETGGIFMTCNLYWRLAEVFAPRIDRALFLGGGGFAMPEDCSRRHPQARVDVVEIDPVVIDVGRRYFRLAEFAAVTPFAADARRFLRDHDTRYDLIFGDAYQGVRNIPAHLVTAEFFALVRARLAPEGLFMANIISPATGDHAQLFRAILRTVRTQFAHADVYSVDPADTGRSHNLIIVASDHELVPRAADDDADEVTGFLLSTRLAPALWEPLDVAPLTDDRNPSELLVARQLLADPS